MSKTITDYTAATTIDAANDYFLIEQGEVYKSINRNTALALASAPVGLTDSQTLSNKVLTAPTINGATLSGTLSGTYTIGGTPTFPSSVTTLTGSQTLTNKTLTAPTINGGTIDNATITVDSISGHTVSTTVTVANLQIANGVLNSANAVTATSIAAGAVQPQALVSGTGSGWSTSSWTPTLTNMTKVDGTVTAKYIQIGKIVICTFDFILGASSTVGTAPQISLPVTSRSYSQFAYLGSAGIYDSSATTAYTGVLVWIDTTHVQISYQGVSGGLAPIGNITATLPMTWAQNDRMSAQFFYEAA